MTLPCGLHAEEAVLKLSVQKSGGGMNDARILIAGIGNIFFGDDAFGVEVAQRLAGRSLPTGVRVVDFGIRGLDLTYALLEGYEAVVLVDAVPQGGSPGSLYVIEPQVEPGTVGAEDLMLQPHSMDPARVLRVARALGGQVQRVLLVGCEPAALGDEENMQMGLSEPVAASVEAAVGIVESLITQLLDSQGQPIK
jgi:hydrogenase maturation protease